jgi:hypothetical protein
MLRGPVSPVQGIQKYPQISPEKKRRKQSQKAWVGEDSKAQERKSFAPVPTGSRDRELQPCSDGKAGVFASAPLTPRPGKRPA